MRLHEEGRNKFKCDLCENEYTDKKSMLRHRDHFHFGQKFTCELCGKDFGQISALKTHVSSVHEKKHYACDICYKVFAYRSTVIEHMKIDHEGAAKKYKCEQCEKAFHKSSTLKRHVRNIHQRKNSIKCKFCTKSLTRMDNLHAHMKRCHKDEYEKESKKIPDGKVDQMLRFLEVNMDNPSNIEGPPEIVIKDEPIEEMEETVYVAVIGDDEDQELQVTQATPKEN